MQSNERAKGIVFAILIFVFAFFFASGISNNFFNTGNVAQIALTPRDLSPSLLTDGENSNGSPDNFTVPLTAEPKENIRKLAEITRDGEPEHYYSLDRLYYAGIDSTSASFPEKITLSDFIMGVEHVYLKGDTEENNYYLYNPTNLQQKYPVVRTDSSRDFSADAEGYLSDGKIYVDTRAAPIGLSTNKTLSNSNGPGNNQSIVALLDPFNQKPRKIIVLVVHQTSTTLPSNWQQHLSGIMQDVRSYYLANSDQKFDLTYGVHELVYNGNPTDIFAILSAADPFVDYSQYDFPMLIIADPGAFSGMASILTDPNGNPYYYPTNEPIASATAIVGNDLSQRSIPNYVPKHEIGHILSFWNPKFTMQDFGTSVPHARGLSQELSSPYSCYPWGGFTQCPAFDYGNALDVMGTGTGIFSYHNASKRAGLRSLREIKNISSSGTYYVCDEQHPLSPTENCFHELLIENPNGADVSVELRTPTGPDAYNVVNNGCNPAYYDGILISVVNTENSSLGFLTFNDPSSYSFRGDVLLPVNGNSSPQCPMMKDFTFGLNQPLSTPLGTIKLTNLVNSSMGGKKGRVDITYQTPPVPPSCITLTDGQVITQSSTICPGNYFLPHGIQVMATSPGQLISVVCDNATLTGVGRVTTKGIELKSAYSDAQIHIRNCQISNYAMGIQISDLLDYAITGNTLIDVFNTGIRVAPGAVATTPHQPPAEISNNFISATQNGTLYSNAGTGIMINGDKAYVDVRNNYMYAGKEGVFVDNTYGVAISHNFIFGPGSGSGHGLLAQNSDSGGFFRNRVASFPNGVELSAGTLNWLVWDNSVFGSTFHSAVDMTDGTTGNNWYYSFDQRGNYWDDHTCIDNAPPIGICENPYTIYSPNSAPNMIKDLFPLAQPV